MRCNSAPSTAQVRATFPTFPAFSGSNKTATTSDDLSFTDLGDGTTSVTYRALVDFHRFKLIGEPLFSFIFGRLADSVPTQMTSVLEKL